MKKLNPLALGTVIATPMAGLLAAFLLWALLPLFDAGTASDRVALTAAFVLIAAATLVLAVPKGKARLARWRERETKTAGEVHI